MCKKACLFLIVLFVNNALRGQLLVGADTISCFENGKHLALAWAGGLNSASFSHVDLNFDAHQDIIAFDKVNKFSYGIFRCYLNKGSVGETRYEYTQAYNPWLPQVQQWACFFDYNADGKSDLFTYNVGGIRVYKNTSTPGATSFVLAKNYLVSNTTPSTAPTYNTIYSSAVALPGFTDVDNDGDLDVLTFSAGGFQLEYHKNLSKELYGHSDSLVYELSESTWGDFSENNCSVVLDQFRASEQALHSGACLMCFDRDGDGDKDLLMGDVACNTMNYLQNNGSTVNAHMNDTTKLYPNYPDKASTNTIKLNTYPCGYHLDVDNDNAKDLIVAPNAINSENFNSVWLYKNTSTTSTVSFQYVKSGFLQDEMLEHGQGAYPVLVDVNADGLLDLVVGNFGYYQSGVNKTMLAYYMNTGSGTQPSYSLMTRDFAGISSFASTNTLTGLVPSFGDIDNDGDLDMVLADYYGKIHWVENTAGSGNPMNFTIYKYNHFNITTTNGAPYPQLIDVDRDNLLDLIVGLRNGRLAYFRNTGTSSAPSFSLITNTFGNVNVKGSPALYSTDGSCAPFMFDDGGTYKLLCGSISGRLFLYDNIDGNLSGNFYLLDTNVNKINTGPNSALQFSDINGDGKRDLIVGNYAGGLHFFSSKNAIGLKEQSTPSSSLRLYPNPASNMVVVDLASANFELKELLLYDMSGRLVLKTTSKLSVVTLHCENLQNGVYLLEARPEDVSQGVRYQKLVIHK